MPLACWARPVHPRVRGEQPAKSGKTSISIGSSPRARGTVTLEDHLDRPGRFIPACAGNRPATRACSGFRPVHPRVRGEQTSTHASNVSQNGSSPRARGTGLDRIGVVGQFRFIPACAGNSRSRRDRGCDGPVHPRVRGEQARVIKPGHNVSGSSPRARGTGAARPALGRWRRFIPACAGNRPARWRRHHPAPVHPRVRGEQLRSEPA